MVNLANHNTVRVFRIGKKEDGSPGNIAAAIDFPQVYFCLKTHRAITPYKNLT